MRQDQSVAQMYDALMHMSQVAASRGQYAIAYHALAAALHCAEELHDRPRLALIGSVARAQVAAMDGVLGDRLLAAPTAASRGDRSLYDALLLQVDATGHRLKLQHAGAEQHGPEPETEKRPG